MPRALTFSDLAPYVNGKINFDGGKTGTIISFQTHPGKIQISFSMDDAKMERMEIAINEWVIWKEGGLILFDPNHEETPFFLEKP